MAKKLTDDQRTIRRLERDFAKVGEWVQTLQTDLKNAEGRADGFREDAEHAETELAEHMATNVEVVDDREWLLDALLAARRAAGHAETCETIYHPNPDNFCNCGRGCDG